MIYCISMISTLHVLTVYCVKFCSPLSDTELRFCLNILRDTVIKGSKAFDILALTN